LAWIHAALCRAPTRLRPGLARIASKTLLDRLPAMRAEYQDGRRFRVPAGDAMYAQVFVLGAYEPEESALVPALLRPGELAIDIGANHGWYSLLMGAAVGKAGRVCAVEPVPAMLGELEANVGLNPTLPIEVCPIALGAAPGTVTLHVFEGLVHGHSSISTLGRDDYTAVEAEMRTLDDLLGTDARPALIKVDVEGAERDVIGGAGATLASEDPPTWMIEVNVETSAAFGYRPADLVADLRAGSPHEVYRVTPDGLVADLAPETAPHGTTWVCVPPGRRDRVAALASVRLPR
jgi:FkbM family methyltransferase